MANNTVSNLQGGVNLAGGISQLAGTVAQTIGGLTFGKQNLNYQSTLNVLNSQNQFDLNKEELAQNANNQNLNTIVGTMIAKSNQSVQKKSTGSKNYVVIGGVVLALSAVGIISYLILKKHKK
ncbi:MAG: hypothetical protein ACRDE2_00260 [Chitinophagaceae bacterium]